MVKVKPETRLGKWSVGAVIFILLYFSLALSLDFDLMEDPSLIATVLFWSILALLFIVGAIALFAGIISITKDKERSLLVFVSTAIGLILFLEITSFLAVLLALALGIRS